ncbi:hypothetical protein CCO03_16070 [Comamonas serinivorans]|uniref:Enoyl-CoA hydratase n=2 Tax=Comamonas serinivorans TaxID=1082851 RepID=A0A1Y0ERV3_9BURK|nr:hypothetical protein CCO03_16070 [Comamonas serinivorans]
MACVQMACVQAVWWHGRFQGNGTAPIPHPPSRQGVRAQPGPPSGWVASPPWARASGWPPRLGQPCRGPTCHRMPPTCRVLATLGARRRGRRPQAATAQAAASSHWTSLDMTPSDAPDLVLVERPEPGLAIVTLNRPQALNALSSALRRQLRRAIDTLNADGQARVLILRGAGRAFCAGLDLKELQQRTQSAAAPAADAGGSPAFLGDAPNVAGSIVGFDGPLIGLVQGAAITGGFELALLCDVLLAAPDARFADTHGRVGILPGSGMSQRLSRRIGIARAKEVSLTGNFIDALTAERWGLVNRVVPHDELLAQGLQLARDMLELPDAMLRGYRQLIDDGFAGSQTAGLALEQARARAWHSAHADGVLAGGGMAALQQRARHTP